MDVNLKAGSLVICRDDEGKHEQDVWRITDSNPVDEGLFQGTYYATLVNPTEDDSHNRQALLYPDEVVRVIGESPERIRELEEKVEVYEHMMHRIQLASVGGNAQRVHDIIAVVCDWSYAHRAGNGELSDEEVAERVHNQFRRLKRTTNE